jgi:hypothetical protein
MNATIAINGQHGVIRLAEIDEDGYLCVEVDLGHIVVRAGIPRDDAIKLAHAMINECRPVLPEFAR